MPTLKKYIRANLLPLILLLVLGIFFSFYHLEQLYGFEFDQERDYYIVKDIVVNHKFTLIGPRVVSSAGFYLGPWYYYLQVPFFAALHGNPVYGAVFTGFFNVVICLLIYFVLASLKRKRLVPFLAALLWVSAANRSNWNVQFVPFFLLLFLFFYHRKNLSLLTLTFAFSLNFHPQMIFLLPIWLYALYRGRFRQPLLLLLSFITPFVPLVFFDLRHQFINTHAALSFLGGSSLSHQGVPAFRLVYSLRQFSTAIESIHPIFHQNVVFASLLLLAGLIFTLKFKKYFHLILIPLLSILVLSFYRELTWPEYYHYLGGFSLFLLLAFSAAEIVIIQCLFALLTVFMVWSNFSYLRNYTNPGSYFFKKEMYLYMLDQNKPYEKLNIKNDFPFGEGLGFQPIREFYEKPTGRYNPYLVFYVSYANNPKHNTTEKIFGSFGVSKFAPIAFWGDSLTAEMVSTSLPEAGVYNGGMFGETSSQIRSRMIAAADKYSWTTIIWVGRNNYSSPNTVKSDIAAMVHALGHQKYLILGVINGNLPLESKGEKNYNTIVKLNRELLTIYKTHFFDTHKFLVSLYNPKNEQDVINYNKDVTPASLLYDDIHLNREGYDRVASEIMRKINEIPL